MEEGHPRSRLGGLEILHVNALKRADHPIGGLASQSSLHTAKFVLASFPFYKFGQFVYVDVIK